MSDRIQVPTVFLPGDRIAELKPEHEPFRGVVSMGGVKPSHRLPGGYAFEFVERTEQRQVWGWKLWEEPYCLVLVDEPLELAITSTGAGSLPWVVVALQDALGLLAADRADEQLVAITRTEAAKARLRLPPA